MILVDYVLLNVPVLGVVLILGVVAGGVLLIARGKSKSEAMTQFSNKLDEWSGFDGKAYSVGHEIPPTVPEPDKILHRDR